jgi:hypothetical protein
VVVLSGAILADLVEDVCLERVKTVRRRIAKGQVPPIKFRVVATGGSYNIYYFENLDLYVKAKPEYTEPGIQPSHSSLMKVSKDFVNRVFEAFKVF